MTGGLTGFRPLKNLVNLDAKHLVGIYQKQNQKYECYSCGWKRIVTVPLPVAIAMCSVNPSHEIWQGMTIDNPWVVYSSFKRNDDLKQFLCLMS